MIIEFKQKEVLFVLTNETPSKLVQCCNCNLIASEEKTNSFWITEKH
jgi:hypothetical protein